VIEAVPTPPEAPPAQTWRTAALILFSLTLVLIALVMVFSVLGLADDGTGGCGGG
jgi:hypothetical protein